MENTYNDKAQKILQSIRYATVATVSPEGKAWNSPVAHDMDGDYHLYWCSDKENQHSVNIRNNSSVFIVIYDSTAPDGEGEGVYIEAIAEELVDKTEIARALSLNPENTQEPEEFLGENIRRYYRANPQRMWMNDAEEKDGVFLRDYRIELSLLK